MSLWNVYLTTVVVLLIVLANSIVIYLWHLIIGGLKTSVEQRDRKSLIVLSILLYILIAVTYVDIIYSWQYLNQCLQLLS